MSQALTQLSEEQQLFADSVYGWAKETIGPRVHQMDADAKMDPAVVKGLFDMEMMGIEIPEEYGGAGADIFTSCLAIEALAKVDPSVSVLCDVQNTLVNNALVRWGTRISASATCRRCAASGSAPTALARRAPARTPSPSSAAPTRRATAGCSTARSSGSPTPTRPRSSW